MIRYNPSASEINLACLKIKEAGQRPIIYCSKSAALRVLPQIVGICVDKDSIPQLIEAAKPGICGVYHGVPVYITDEAEEAFIILPQHMEGI